MLATGQKAKMGYVQRIVDWRPEVLTIARPERAMLEAAFAGGIGAVGTFYQTNWNWEIRFLLEFARAVRGRDGAEVEKYRSVVEDLCDGVDNRKGSASCRPRWGPSASGP
jgi:hypothetical protein